MSLTLSMIVSAYDRPEHLKLCLQSLKLQTVATRMQVFVADNSTVEANNNAFRSLLQTDFLLCGYYSTKMRECYESAEMVVRSSLVTGDFLGFPSDDNWYAPEYCERMLKAAEKNAWDLVYCDCLFDPRWSGHYTTQIGSPVPGGIDKGGFIVRRSLFLELGGFPGKNGGASASDGLFVQAAAARCMHGRVPEVMWFHG